MILILDPGHGGINSKGEYTTAPAKMHTFPDGTTIYEGEINRKIVRYIADAFNCDPTKNTKIVYTVEPDNPIDVTLGSRVRFANKYNPRNSLYISIHNNAGGGTGGEVFTSVGETKADKLAEEVIKEMEVFYNDLNFPMRKDFRDGDSDKEAPFYVLRKTKCPAILVEGLFFDNKRDAKFLKDEQFLKNLGQIIYNGIKKYIDGEESFMEVGRKNL